jgi:hypothetical protein
MCLLMNPPFSVIIRDGRILPKMRHRKIRHAGVGGIQSWSRRSAQHRLRNLDSGIRRNDEKGGC